MPILDSVVGFRFQVLTIYLDKQQK